MRALRQKPALSVTLGVVAVVVIALIGWLAIPGGPAPATRPVAGGPTGGSTATGVPTDTGPAKGISGFVYYDRNGNGVRDPGEPGIEGIRVRDKKGDVSTLTSPTGAYAFPEVPDSPLIQVETGWFRSRCPAEDDPTAMNCAADTGTNNEFKVNNQFVQYALTGAPANNVDVGLLPDWPGTSMTEPAASGGAVPANAVDVAARLSWDSGTCADPVYAICGVGDTFSMDAEVFNQGTTPLTGIHARIYVPPGDCATGVSLLDYSVPAGLGAVTVTPSAPTCDTRYLDVSYAGTLAPAGGARLEVDGRTAAGPGTPGCKPGAINKDLCPDGEPQSRGWLFGISHIDQTGDPDSTFCAAGDMTQCPIGLHDKRRSPDEIDPAGHTVDAALGGTTQYDLTAHVTALDVSSGGETVGEPGAAKAGGDVTLRAWLGNQLPGGAATNASPEGVTVHVWLPAGAVIEHVPPQHKLISCDNGRPAGGGVMVTCVLGAPVAASMSSPAVDVIVGVPADWPAAKPFRAVVCADPPAGGATTEAVPAAGACDDTTDADATATNDDADFAWTISR